MSDPEASTVHARLHAHASVESSVARAAERLRDAGQRITAPRRSVLRVLAQHHEHLRADEVADLLDADGVHRATVYRTLELLAETGVVSCRALPGGATGYHLDALADEQEHLHAHCRSCSRVVALPARVLDAAVESVERAVGFRLAPQRSDLTGLCSGCARASA
jgi:Fur family ferric uptake transcriptional regulator